jgi:hypothetical protein
VTKLDDDTFDQKLRDGSINPEMQRKDVARANRILNRERDRQRLENLLPIRDSAFEFARRLVRSVLFSRYAAHASWYNLLGQ